ncbi:MAG: Methyltransferase type 11 [Parcubacteria group bacterium GW2011_GWA2_38_13]|nr:MAG: Methyltransferase type 11 [Parcubacteria group bacterium GW2011_GWA2_38_13]
MVYVSGGNQLIDAKFILKKIRVHEGKVVADLGCGGAGHFIIPAGKWVGKKSTVYAVDILRSALEEVSKKARLMGIKNIKTIWSNLEIPGSTKLSDNELDIAFLINILFQSKEDKNIMTEAARILKPGGKLLVIDWNSTRVPFGPPLVDRVDPNEIKEIAKTLGLKIMDEFDAGKFHFGLIFKKQ